MRRKNLLLSALLIMTATTNSSALLQRKSAPKSSGKRQGANKQAPTKIEQKIYDQVKRLIADELGVDEKEVTLNARFIEDLGADSLDAVELIMRFEEAFDLQIPDKDAERIRTVRDACVYVQEHVKK